MKRTIALTFIVALVVAVATWFVLGKSTPPVSNKPHTQAAAKPMATAVTVADAKASAAVTPAAVPANPTASATPQSVQQQCEAIFKIGNATERKLAFDKLLAAATDPFAVKAILDNFNVMFAAGRRFDSEWVTFWQTIGHRDPQGTMALIESYGADTTWYHGAIRRTLTEWASAEPDAAMKWLDGNQALSGEDFDDAALSLVAGYAARDLDAATAYAMKVFKPGLYGSSKLNMLLSRTALQQRGMDGMIEWFRAFPTGEEKTAMFNSIANRLDEVDPTKKRAWLEAEARQPYRNDISYRELVQEIATTDPRTAMDYLSRLPRSPRDGGMPGVGAAAFAWLDKDVAEFVAYYRTVPLGDLRTNIVKAINNSLQTDANLAAPRRAAATQFLQAIGQQLGN